VSLYKRGNVWWAYFFIDGVRHQESTGTSNRRHAERIAQQLKDDAVLRHHGVQTADPNMTFAALAARFIATAGPRPHHLDRLKHLLPYFEEYLLRSITRATVREYRAARHAAKSMSDATINRDVAVLRHLLYWAVDEGLLVSNPLARLRLAPERRAPRPVLTIHEEDLLLTAAPPHLKQLIVLALDTGMRRRELLLQRWEHVDLDRRVLHVTRSKTVQGEGREIPLTSRVVDLLDAQSDRTGLLFEWRGHAIGTVKTAWLSTVRRAKVRHVRFHDLRHTFNTRLLEAGVLQEIRKSLMGHVSGGGIHSVYTHIELPLKRLAIGRLEQWLTEQRTPATRATTNTNTNNNSEQESLHERTKGGDAAITVGTKSGSPQTMAKEDTGGSLPGADKRSA
jgi:integrase